ncbi:MAG: hypothetical protein WCR20_23825 [Verrucomicrobiota bacterium]
MIQIYPLAGRPSAPPFQKISNLEITTIGRSQLSDLVVSFGQPVMVDSDQHWAIFRTCTTGSNWWWVWFFPTPTPPLPMIGGNQCQTIGFWFGTDGKVTKVKAWWDDFNPNFSWRQNDVEDLAELRRRMTDTRYPKTE